MSDLISRFEEDLQLAGYANRSIQSYAAGLRRLQRFHQKPLEDITEEDLRQYWLACKAEFGWSAATLRISYSAIKHFFTRTLVRPWSILNQVHFKRDETLPTVLSTDEVRRIIDHLPTLQSHTFYTTLYSLGMRLSEALTLEVRDIFSDRGLVHIRGGKGASDRMVPLPDITLKRLRGYYVTHRNPRWIFPALGHSNGKHAGTAKTHASTCAVQDVLRRNVKLLPGQHLMRKDRIDFAECPTSQRSFYAKQQPKGHYHIFFVRITHYYSVFNIVYSGFQFRAPWMMPVIHTSSPSMRYMMR